MVSQAEFISKGYHSLVPGIISISLETVWVPLSLRLNQFIQDISSEEQSLIYVNSPLYRKSH